MKTIRHHVVLSSAFSHPPPTVSLLPVPITRQKSGKGCTETGLPTPEGLVPHGKFGGLLDTTGSAMCTDCLQVKPNAHFTFYTNRFDKHTKVCHYINKKCDTCRQAYRKHKGQSVQHLKRLKIVRPQPTPENPYPCDCCRKPIVTSKTLQLDHCHQSGTFRGWLCKECNISMGNLGDNIEGFIRAIKYLNRTEKLSTETLKQLLEGTVG